MSTSVYSGSLRPKKKAELQAIARDLAIQLDEGTKVEYEAAIRTTLRQSKAFQSDRRFADLWKSILEGEARRSSARAKSEAKSEAGEDDSETESSPVKLARRAIEAAPAAVEQGLQRVTRATQQVQEQALALQQQASQNELVVATQQAAEEYSSALVKFTEHKVVPLIKDVQNQLSNSWVIIATTLAIEALFILSVTVPYNRKVHLQPWKWATFQLTPDHPWSVTLPDLAVIAQLSFARVFVVWIFSSVIAPLIVSSVIVFPHPQGGFHEPSPLTFSLIRLATDLYLNRIAPAPVFGDWAVSVLSRFGDLQLLLAGLSAAFALYEVVA